MNRDTARAIEQIAGPLLVGTLAGPHEIGLGEWPIHARGVYIVYDAWDKCVYVGKVCSDADAERLKSRFNEHLGDPRKLNHWHHFHVLALNGKASNAHVQKVEGFVARHLRPTDSLRSPNPRRRPRRIRRAP